VILSSSGGVTTYKNAPGTSRSGWELAATSLINQHVRASISASAIDAQYSEAFTSGSTSVASGSKLPGIPQHFLFGELLWANQGLDTARRKQRLGTTAGIEVISAGRLYADDTNANSADGYTVFNLKASHGWSVGKGQLTAYARADNVSDQRYVGSVIVNQSSSQFYEPAPGFNWALGVRLNLPL